MYNCKPLAEEIKKKKSIDSDMPMIFPYDNSDYGINPR